MKRLTAILMSLLLMGSSTAALADRGGHRDSRHGGDNYRHHDKHGGKHYGKQHYRDRGKYRGYRQKHHVYYYPQRAYPRPYYRPHAYYGYDPYLPLGAALVGTAIGYSLGNSNNNVTTTTYSQTTRSQVSGCFRIERYPDGSERRVELPPYECY